ncbi:MAG: DUF2442 domain-containing protein [Candidatus Riflebacteria bacterium]|nr:DUF2442 domain-containing protein [Candidatus Riflebacteria bacterium]
MIWVTNAKYVRDYILRITFNDGTNKIVDLQNELEGGVFAPLKDKEYFKKFRISANTIEWENGADFAPEFLHSLPNVTINLNSSNGIL